MGYPEMAILEGEELASRVPHLEHFVLYVIMDESMVKRYARGPLLCRRSGVGKEHHGTVPIEKGEGEKDL
jgi:hypothetical protein